MMTATLQKDDEREQRLKQREADIEAREKQFEIYIKQERDKVEKETALAHTKVLDLIRAELIASQDSGGEGNQEHFSKDIIQLVTDVKSWFHKQTQSQIATLST